jgi:CheY-like chemotaxis protein
MKRLLSTRTHETPFFIVVDDNIPDTMLLEFGFAELHADCVVKAINAGALPEIVEQILTVSGNRRCMVIVDLRLGPYDGLDIVRAINKRPNLKLGVLTALMSPVELRTAKALGVDFYKIKPCYLDGWVGLARELLDELMQQRCDARAAV